MKISVIVPTYKPKAYLRECLDSIYNQTFPKNDYELILVLNGCNEPFNAQIKEWLSKHSDLQVQYFQIDEGGVSNARNIGLDNVRGEYITFIDDDDYVSPFYLQQLYSKAAPNTISLCYPYAFNDGKPGIQLPYPITCAYDKWVNKQPVKFSSTVRKFFSGPCMKLIPMSFIHDRRFNPDFRNGEDSLFMFLISDKFDNFAFTDRSAVYYRRYRTGSAMTSYRSRSEIIRNSFSILWEYTHLFFKGIPHYNFGFYVTRMLATIRSMI